MTELFRDGDWRLIRCSSSVTGFSSSDIQHLCERADGTPWWYFAYDGSCGVCHEEIPEPILGLRNLHRWDR